MPALRYLLAATLSQHSAAAGRHPHQDRAGTHATHGSQPPGWDSSHAEASPAFAACSMVWSFVMRLTCSVTRMRALSICSRSFGPSSSRVRVRRCRRLGSEYQTWAAPNIIWFIDIMLSYGA